MADTSAPPTSAPERPEPQPQPRTRRRLPVPVLAVLFAAVVIGVVAVLGVLRGDQPKQRPPVKPEFVVAELSPKPGSAAPFTAAHPPVQLDLWSRQVADRTDIPARVVIAYAAAEQTMQRADPGCRISWTTLAGVGRVESAHGEYGGTEVRVDGTLSEPIIGIALDGSEGVKAIRDTDRGMLDGDQVWDHAVGAMQFVPTTWHKYAVRANGDGRAPDPQNVDDAALASARYLCSAGGDLTTATGWWQGILTYNQSVSYGRDVFSGADAYARATH